MNTPRNSLKKTKECSKCKKEKVIWKNVDGEKLCKECSLAKDAKKPKSTKPAKKKLKPISKLKQELDIVFSWYIRLRDSDSDGYTTCATCGERAFWSKHQNGHFISRTHMSTRFHEQNCSAQCLACNVYKSGQQYLHSIYLDKKWGEGTSLKMLQLSNEVVKLSREWYEEKIAYYREEVSKLKKEKNIE